MKVRTYTNTVVFRIVAFYNFGNASKLLNTVFELSTSAKGRSKNSEAIQFGWTRLMEMKRQIISAKRTQLSPRTRLWCQRFL